MTTVDMAASNGGAFNFQQMMKDFYNYKPGEDDDEGRMMKNAFQGNFLQSAVDANLSQMLGQFNNSLAQSNMTHAADLEQRNQSALMKDEFNYGMQNMDAQFQYQNEFANAQHDRDLGMVGAVGEQDRLNIQAQGQQDRLGVITQGEQQRLTDAQNNASAEKIAQGSYDKDRDVANIQKESQMGTAQIGADADRDVASTQADASRDVASTQADADKFKATAAADASKYGADKTVEVAEVNAQGTIDNTKETGNQTRLTQDNETRNKAKDRANMHTYARSTARAF